MEEHAMETLTDQRRTYTFYVDDAVLDVFGPRIGAYGIAVYTLLARHAKQKESFPSYRHIMKQLGISRMTLWRTIDVLIKEGLIQKKQRESTRGDLTSNLYILMDLSMYRDCSESPSVTTGGSTCEILPSTCGILPSTSQVLHLKESLLRDLREEEDIPPLVTLGSPLLGDTVHVNGTKPVKVRAKKEKRTETYFPTDPDAQEAIRLLVFNEALSKWVARKGITLDLDDQWERFTRKALSKGYKYVDWHLAFMDWLTSPYQVATGPQKKTAQERQEALKAWADKGMQETRNGS